MRISDWSSDVCSSDLNVPRRGERWKLMLKLNLRVPLLFLLLLPFLVMFLPLQKRRAKKRNNKTQKTSATSGLLTVLRPSAKRKKNNSKERFVSKERVVRVLPIISPCLRTLLPSLFIVGAVQYPHTLGE